MDLWEIINRSNTIVELALAVPVVWSWLILLTQRRRQRALIKNIEAMKGKVPVAILVDLGPGESENQVRSYLVKENLDMEILKYTARELRKEDLDTFVEELQNLKAEAMKKGADKVHLFYRQPVVGALIVGEVFSNFPVNIYHYNKNGSYESWGPLHRTFL